MIARAAPPSWIERGRALSQSELLLQFCQQFLVEGDHPVIGLPCRKKVELRIDDKAYA
ncbi:hypothetical protein ABIC78_001617 [Novosphingobium sp. 1529]|uniref:hypothetical protein n=1 Tax=Novosphingobium TaxID=165696 RepID=UPI000B29BEDC|nr:MULTISPECIES: hypothetical protein [Novosphingobium]WQD91484.1 hypothetical protein U0041_10695 [Novosphingobium capsulatum]